MFLLLVQLKPPQNNSPYTLGRSRPNAFAAGVRPWCFDYRLLPRLRSYVTHDVTSVGERLGERLGERIARHATRTKQAVFFLQMRCRQRVEFLPPNFRCGGFRNRRVRWSEISTEAGSIYKSLRHAAITPPIEVGSSAAFLHT